QVIDDRAFPWGAIGLVMGSRLGTGTLVGPRHLLTACHISDWHGTTSVGPIRFAAAYSGSGAPFGIANVERVFAFRASDHTLDEFDASEDLLVCILDQRVGSKVGWLGCREYDLSWNGHSYWTHIGFEMTSTGEPALTYQDGIAFDSAHELKS